MVKVHLGGVLGLALEDGVDELVLPLAGGRVELELAADLAELRDGHLPKVGDGKVVPLAGGFELLLLLEFTDGSAIGGLGSTTWLINGVKLSRFSLRPPPWFLSR